MFYCWKNKKIPKVASSVYMCVWCYMSTMVNDPCELSSFDYCTDMLSRPDIDTRLTAILLLVSLVASSHLIDYSHVM